MSLTTEETRVEITHEKAVEIDTELADLYTERAKRQNVLSDTRQSLHYALRINKTKQGRSWVWPFSLNEVVAKAEAKLAEGWSTYDADRVRKMIDNIPAAQAAVNEVTVKIDALEALHDEHQWSRFFLVNNTNGHIHSSMSCSTCNWRTSFSWLPTLSGLTEKDAVDAHGCILCSVCFPSAPTEWTVGNVKEADPNQCPGSGTGEYSDYRRTGYNGTGRGFCKHCNEFVSVTTTGKMRKHKKEA